MIKRNKWKMAVSSVIILLPILAGLILWNDLPRQMATHWGIGGSADRWSGRAFAVFGMPLTLLAVHWICALVISLDPRNKNQSPKATGLIFWVCPAISLYVSAIIYTWAFGMEVGMDIVLPAAMGLMFLVIGNYLPKCRQSHTIGIKVLWALRDEGNWNATHRFGGKVWVIGGVLLLLCVFLPKAMIPYTVVGIAFVLGRLPVAYSYIYYRRNL